MRKGGLFEVVLLDWQMPGMDGVEAGAPALRMGRAAAPHADHGDGATAVRM